MTKCLTALVDLDAMLHIVANVQFSAGNMDNPGAVRDHITRFVTTVQQSAKANQGIMFYQKQGHTNFRNVILPQYKEHRTTSDAIQTWKSTILETFESLGAIGLQHLESDDAVSVVADALGYKNVVIISSDKDMIQVPCMHYNPYKSKITEEERWHIATYATATKFFWEQVLVGDSTDMPNNMCGIQGVGMKTATKILDDSDDTYVRTIMKAYGDKYGKQEGYARANRTFMMVRLLTKHNNGYVCPDALEEVKMLVNEHAKYLKPITNPVDDLFTKAPKPSATLDLFFRK